ncbi:MAG: hypothetical protein LWX07_09625 [Bacteroidetes bacterium]|nr:hypothetical protein [Bacteroidota bacterium]
MLRSIKISVMLLLTAAFIQTGCKKEDDLVEYPINIDTSTGMYYVGKLESAGDVRYVKGYTINKVQYAFMACGGGGFSIANVSNGESPALTYRNTTGGFLNEVFADSVKGVHYAFLSNTFYGLSIFDVSVPSSPVQKVLISGAGVTSMCKKDSLLYAATDNGLNIYNTNYLPDSIIRVASYTPANTVKHIEISGNVCCLVEVTTGLEFVNITDPLHPVQYSTFGTPGACNDIKIAGNAAYVADGMTGVSVINISNPSQPYFVRSINTKSNVLNVDYSPNFLFSADGTYGPEVFNLFDPSKPDMIGYYEPSGTSYSVHYYKAKVLVANGTNGLLILRF